MANPRISRQFQVHVKLLEPVCSKVTQAYTYKEWMENNCFPGVYASLHHKEEKLVSVGIISNAKTQRIVTSATVNNGAHASCASSLLLQLASVVAMSSSQAKHTNTVEI
ncbi:uncharacterized protein APUU_50905A [Aspergillus puulaauensis]|uniref:Uncharacterized protein n=1 Tax=Aspergillus puulaauensis TaxID=1220207 RepID=A0A7R7XRN5_9EURO|nr:uncharacterized protein APUU_50905A [Aspergillus puulaauensis]BCS26194.1 hypothetical protein APUU_50905A [Aspergillus puulaauensis]